MRLLSISQEFLVSKSRIQFWITKYKWVLLNDVVYLNGKTREPNSENGRHQVRPDRWKHRQPMLRERGCEKAAMGGLLWDTHCCLLGPGFTSSVSPTLPLLCAARSILRAPDRWLQYRQDVCAQPPVCWKTVHIFICTLFPFLTSRWGSSFPSSLSHWQNPQILEIGEPTGMADVLYSTCRKEKRVPLGSTVLRRSPQMELILFDGIPQLWWYRNGGSEF